VITAMAMRQNTIQYNPDERETLTITEVPCLKDEINRLVYDLYGLTPEEIRIINGEIVPGCESLTKKRTDLG
jgi:hypothetical protein